MAKPWEKYATQDSNKPWEKYEDGSQSVTIKDNESDLSLSDLITGRNPEPSFLNQLGRQAGLTARIGIEGVSDLGEAVLNQFGKESPSELAINQKINPNYQPRGDIFSGAGSRAADFLGLPKPDNAAERVVNTTGRMTIPVGTSVRAGQVVERMASSPLAKKLAQQFSANPSSQLQSVAGAGVAGGTAREMGGGEGAQLMAALTGGLVTPALLARNATGAQLLTTPSNVEARAEDALKTAIPQFESLAPEIQATLRQDTINALRTGENLSGDALSRLGDYRTVGAQPMRSSLTLNPADVTRDQNLVKMSATSQDPAAQVLSTVRRDNKTKLLDFINRMGAQNAGDRVDAGQNVINSLNTIDESASANISGLYNKARATSGRSANIDAHTFTNRANDLLDDAMIGGNLPVDVRNKLNSIATGEMPLTVDVAEQLKTRIYKLQKLSKDPSARLALANVRQALDEAPLLEGQGQAAIDAFGRARDANREYMKIVEATPALKAVRDGVEPDRFVYDFITGPKSTIKEMDNLRRVVQDSPEALDTIRSQILKHLKSKGTGGAADEVASFSAKPFNDELDKFGDGKLRIFFSPKEIQELKALGRVGTYETHQPPGSAVNNSNSGIYVASMFIKGLEKLGASGLLRKVPLGNFVANQANDIVMANNARRTLDPSTALTTKSGAMPLTQRALENLEQVNPALGIGLLSSPE